MKIIYYFFILFNLLHLIYSTSKVNLNISNRSGHKVRILWKNPLGSLVDQLTNPMRNNTDNFLNSFSTHSFVAQIDKDNETSKQAEFTLLDIPNQTYTIFYNSITGGLYGQLEKTRGRIEKLIGEKTDMCWDTYSKENSTQDLKECIESSILETVSVEEEEERRLLKYRNIMSEKLRNYTCADINIDTTPTTPLSSVKYNHLDKSYNVNFYMNYTDARIFSINDTFVTPEECEHLISYARPRLSTATVSGSGSKPTISNARRAQQAAYSMKDRNNNPLWPLYKRILDTVNHFTGYRILPNGQEGLNVIQYNPGDEYTPHCDGACNGSRYKKGGRVATAILYCQTPELGGATTFTKADIIIKGKPGQATFFSYYEQDKDGKGGLMDRTGMTEHSGCDVKGGEKWIATAWLRLGLTDEINYTFYDPRGNVVDKTVYEVEEQEIEEENIPESLREEF